MTQPQSSPVTRGLEGQLHVASGKPHHHHHPRCFICRMGGSLTVTNPPPPAPARVSPQQGSFCLVLLVSAEREQICFEQGSGTRVLPTGRGRGCCTGILSVGRGGGGVLARRCAAHAPDPVPGRRSVSAPGPPPPS